MSPTDKELLELAAKVAGVMLDWDVHEKSSPWRLDEDGYLEDIWNPLAYDGDALRLAVKLNMDVDVGRRQITVLYFLLDGDGDVYQVEEPGEKSGNDPYAATRRAIVRAAAEIGKHKD